MPRVSFIGLGLNDEKGITLQGLEDARQSDHVFAEFYTSIMPNLNLTTLEETIGKGVEVLDRTQLEDEGGRRIISAAEQGKVAFLVPGDPMIATTHVSLRLALAKRGIESRIIHGSSIVSAVCGSTGLQSYKFGKSTTLPKRGPVLPSTFETLRENRARGLHTLLLLEILEGEKSQLTIRAAVEKLVEADRNVADWLAVGAARIGSRDEITRAAKARTLAEFEFGPVPHLVVFPGRLHFMEAEALKAFCRATDQDLEAVQ